MSHTLCVVGRGGRGETIPDQFTSGYCIVLVVRSIEYWALGAVGLDGIKGFVEMGDEDVRTSSIFGN